MNEKAIFMLGVGRKVGILFHKLTADEIIESYEFEKFEKAYPELARLAKGG